MFFFSIHFMLFTECLMWLVIVFMDISPFLLSDFKGITFSQVSQHLPQSKFFFVCLFVFVLSCCTNKQLFTNHPHKLSCHFWNSILFCNYSLGGNNSQFEEMFCNEEKSYVQVCINNHNFK